MRFVLFQILAVSFLAKSVLACPDIDGLADRNCDGVLTIAVFGDSIVKSEGDEEDVGGYPGRLKLLYFPNATIHNFGKGGETTRNGRRRLPAAIRNRRYDYAIIAEGINDYFERSHSVSKTKSNLSSMTRTMKNDTGAITLLANLTDTTRRTKQATWIRKLNKALASDVDFFSLGRGIIGRDKLHPNASGYARMAAVAANSLLDKSEAHRPSDTDADGLYDFEEQQYGTSPDSSDTDADGKSDGEEVYEEHSNPLSADTDGDGLDDARDPNPSSADVEDESAAEVTLP